MKKTRRGIFKVYYFASGTYSLAFKVYLECVYLYLAIHSLILSIFGLFRDFAPIPMYGECEKTCHPYIGSTTVLPDMFIY